MNNKTNIAVYGTLKKGRGNHGYLHGQQVVMNNAVTENKYGMYQRGLEQNKGIPYVVEDETSSKIAVEVYAVDEEALRMIDRLEGHPTWYERKLIKVHLKDDKKVSCKAWLYFNPLAADQKKALTLNESGVF